MTKNDKKFLSFLFTTMIVDVCNNSIKFEDNSEISEIYLDKEYMDDYSSDDMEESSDICPDEMYIVRFNNGATITLYDAFYEMEDENFYMKIYDLIESKRKIDPIFNCKIETLINSKKDK